MAPQRLIFSADARLTYINSGPTLFNHCVRREWPLWAEYVKHWMDHTGPNSTGDAPTEADRDAALRVDLVQ